MHAIPHPAAGTDRPAWIARHPLVAYFGLAYVISWAFEIPLAAAKQGWIQFPVPFAIHYLASFGPMLAALITAGMLEGRSGLRALFSGLLKWRVGLGWWLFSAFSPVVLFALSVLAMRTMGGAWPNLSLLGQVDYLPYLGIVGAVLLWLLTYGLGEEIGWRGFALPRLQKQHSALTASLILSVFWAFWHTPAFLYRDVYMAMGLAAGLPMLLISVAAAAIIFTWIYNSTGGSLLMVVLFHAMFDFLLVSPAANQTTSAILNAATMIWAVLVVIVFKPANLSRVEKQVS
ncbi:MAG TPA: type II CAAX endopeptidase family protein [Roseiflexaceae bacterium]|nr:type II CAAX endopeptidase family protein [Roseiflexaceae bacterium]